MIPCSHPIGMHTGVVVRCGQPAKRCDGKWLCALHWPKVAS